MHKHRAASQHAAFEIEGGGWEGAHRAAYHAWHVAQAAVAAAKLKA